MHETPIVFVEKKGQIKENVYMKYQKGSKKPKDFRFDPFSIYKMFDGKKYQFIGAYPKSDEFIWDIERIHKKHGFTLKVEPIEDNRIRLWKKK